MSKLKRIVKMIERFNEINQEDHAFIADKLRELDNITDICPHCGCTEFLCGFNGVGCSSEGVNNG